MRYPEKQPDGSWKVWDEATLLASDVMLGPIPPPPKPEEELEIARERARLSVLNLTERDKRFLRAMKIEC